MKKIKVGIIGMGYIGESHIEAVRRIGCCELYAVAEAAELVELKKHFPERVAAVNFNYRLNPMVQEMKNRIADGKIGIVRVMTGSYQQDWLLYDTDYSWRLEPEVSGNSCAIADIGSHWMDAVQHVTGHKIVEVMADLKTVIPVRKKPKKQTETFSDNVPTEFDEVLVQNEDYGAVLFHTDKGATGVYHVSQVSAGRGCYLNFEISGSTASLRWNQEQNDRLWMGVRGGDNHLIIRDPNVISGDAKKYTALAKGHPEGWNDAFKGNIFAFYKYIEDGMQGEPVFSTLEQAAYVVKLTEAIIESSKKKAWVKVEE